MSSALVVYSGGLDSYTLLNKALQNFKKVEAITFDYGQKHKKEIDYAKNNCLELGIAHKVIKLDIADLLSNSALVGDSKIPEGNYDKEKMKQTIVPNRNMIMISIAASLAIKNKLQYLWYAAHAGDHEIYPDCRPYFIQNLNETLRIGTMEHRKENLRLVAPFIQYDKTWIAAKGKELGVPFEKTWTCYKGLDKHCGKCGACVERKEAFRDSGGNDPTIYED